jgi:hypothetical protein
MLKSDFICLQLLGSLEVQPDLRVDGYTVVMSFLSAMDALFFVAYAHILDTFGSLFSVRMVQ